MYVYTSIATAPPHSSVILEDSRNFVLANIILGGGGRVHLPYIYSLQLAVYPSQLENGKEKKQVRMHDYMHACTYLSS